MSNARPGLDREFRKIQDNILRMGSLLDSSIERAIASLSGNDQALARQVIADDQQVNDLRFTIEEECLALIATQQPAASDLRAVIAAMNIVNDLERMGDHAAGIAKTALRMEQGPLPQALGDIGRMAQLAREMLKTGLDAYLARDAEMARQTAEHDDELDALYNQIFRVLVSYMVEEPRTITRGTYMLWVAHNLERIGDRVTNIAERVIFMTTGKMKELNT